MYVLNRWEQKVLLANCEIFLRLNPNDVNDDILLELCYDLIDFLLEDLNMRDYELEVMNDNIHFLKAMLGLVNPNEIFESAYQKVFLFHKRLK